MSPLIGGHPDYKAKNTLANLYKDLLQDRTVKASKFQTLLDHSEEAIAFYQALQRYEEEQKNWKSLQEVWEENYPQALLGIRRQFQKLLSNEVLGRGLPLSSLSIYQRLQQYLNKSPEAFRKKEWQTERSALQFISRIVAKTSPFSTFTTLSVQSLVDPGFQIEAGSQVRINNYILAYLQALLESIPGFYHQLRIKVNPSLRLQNGQLTFLLNSQNLESLQQIEQSPVLEALLELMEGKRKTFAQLLEKALKYIDADQAQVEAYLLQLLQYGLIEWDWGLSGRDVQWLLKLQSYLSYCAEFPLQAEIVDLLKHLQVQQTSLAQAAGEQRSQILPATAQKLKAFFDQHHQETDPEMADPTTFTRIQVGAFHFKAEKLFYEDVSSHHDPVLSESAVEPLINRLDRLICLLDPLYTSPWKTAVARHFEEHYPDATKVDLLRFYDSFFRQRITPGEEPATPHLDEILDGLEAGNYFDPSKGECRISLEDLEDLLPPSSPSTVAHSQGPTHAAMLQFCQAENEPLIAFVESNFLGNGKMMGRFLHLFPERVVHTVRKWNRQMQVGEIWVENVDASYFNANLYPTLLAWEVASPGSQNLLLPHSANPGDRTGHRSGPGHGRSIFTIYRE